MAERRQRYNEEFKKETVKYAQSHAKSLTVIADELNIPVGTLQNWMSKYRTFVDEPVSSREELLAAQRKIKDLEEELEILKKAVHFFSKDRK